MEEIIITYDQIQSELLKLKKEIKKNYDVLIGIKRGGVILTGMFQYILNNRNIDFLDITLYNQKYRRKEKIYTYEMIKNIYENFKNYSNILIIDDICDTGSTFNAIELAKRNYDLNINIDYFSLFYNKESNFKINYYCFKKPKNSWIIFPWEKLEEGESL